MRIVRFIDEEGRTCWGSLRPDQTGEAGILRGDPFGEFGETGKTARIVRVLAPVEPRNILAVGLNYGGHAAETKIARPEMPVMFLKATTSVIGPEEMILLPSVGPDRVDYEAELAVIIGRRAKNVRREDALGYVLGYTCANDVSARDWQIEKQKKQWARGKSFDTFCPLGPCVVTADEIPDPNRLGIRALLNGEVMQASNTSDMIFDVPSLISDLSRSFTLLPGTVILTGTPEGVGFTREPAVFLREGDVIAIEIDRIGSLSNKVGREAE
ncbi:MAG: fumarylacetoacetate hydrolase family protein [Deltaproteobacteria bacterium]|nr:fumarylacetoacetate hydrolase family protein [Deltaproteobacteria bacterium]